MTTLSGFGRSAAAALLISGIAFSAPARAQEVTADHLKAARDAITALSATDRFDIILPTVAEQLKAQLIQSSPNFQDAIGKTVDAQALALAPRRADLEKESATIYAKTFSTEELKAISAFYSSDAGKKLLKDGPIATRELLKAADIWATGVQRDLTTNSAAALQKAVGAEIKTDVPAAGAAPKP
jgi:hypothetical protein